MPDLLADFKRYVGDVQASSGYAAWARDNHGPKNDPNFSISLPKQGSELQRWYAVRDAIVAGGRPTLPDMATAFGKALVDVAREHLDATAPVTPPPKLKVTITGTAKRGEKLTAAIGAA